MPESPASPRLVQIAAVLALLAVTLGAFGAHALKDRLVELGTLETWRTAVNYHIWHALALLLLARGGAARPVSLCFIAGILLFSGSLYLLALGGPGWLGPITPLGGLSFMLGWILLAAKPIMNPKPDRSPRGEAR